MSGLVFVGANPALLLRGADGGTFASLWLADWTPVGAGRALLVAGAAGSRLVSDAPDVARWLVERFTLHFPEAREVGLTTVPTVEPAEVAVDLDLARGLTATAADLELVLDGPTAPEVVDVGGIELSGTSYDLRNVTVPCGGGRLVVAGTTADGDVATAFLAVAETWVER